MNNHRKVFRMILDDLVDSPSDKFLDMIWDTVRRRLLELDRADFVQSVVDSSDGIIDNYERCIIFDIIAVEYAGQSWPMFVEGRQVVYDFYDKYTNTLANLNK